MASSLDVMSVIAEQVAAFVYPSGTSEPSVTGGLVSCVAGWPIAEQLENGVDSTTSIVSVYCLPGGQNTTRYPTQNHRISTKPVTLSWAVSGITATLSGTVSTPQNVAIIVDNVAYVYGVQATDTLASIAAALAALIVVDRPCTSSGAVISIPNARTIVARVGSVSNVAAEWSRQRKRFQVRVWCASPTSRAQIVDAILPGFAPMHFITMPDGYGARIRYQDDAPIDITQKSLLYCHDLFYEVEYATTVASTAPQAIVWTVNAYGGSAVDPGAEQSGSPSITFNF
jgi:hypothetical protein